MCPLYPPGLSGAHKTHWSVPGREECCRNWPEQDCGEQGFPKLIITKSCSHFYQTLLTLKQVV